MIDLQRRFRFFLRKERVAWEVLDFSAPTSRDTASSTDGGYRAMRNPPRNPARDDVDWRDALILGIATGAFAGLMRILFRRLAAAGWRSWRGKWPPFR